MPVALGAALVGVFAILHGHAHGAELPAGAAAVTYAAGFALATALLHAPASASPTCSRGDSGKLIVRGAGAPVARAGVVLAVI